MPIDDFSTADMMELMNLNFVSYFAASKVSASLVTGGDSPPVSTPAGGRRCRRVHRDGQREKVDQLS